MSPTSEEEQLRSMMKGQEGLLREWMTRARDAEAEVKMLKQERDDARAEAERLRTLAGQLFHRLETPEYDLGAWPDGLYDAGCDAWEQTKPAPGGEGEE